ncbi:MAG: exodeoxyribonuclease VII large subunit [Caulobacteraceae bacterium]
MTDDASAETEDSNAPAYTVSELAFALKRTIEAAYGFVRLRGEISKVTFHASGHVYLDLKDERACISGVIWKGQAGGLAIRPQTGLEVIVTGKITTYPGRSQYQIVIETMEAAGIGALLAQLERLKAALAAEGLFDASRKRPLPAMPTTIGVITSPTGAVIRDILHRIRERWPCRVIVWPVVVQGDQAAAQVSAAIEGIGALAAGGAIPRPDLIIVARGGGSVEDLWPFNDEALARAAAASPIPLISAVGHETDTTLIDFVADRRAPTPTAAAEMATPVFADLAASLADHERRMIQCGAPLIDHRRALLAAAAGGLPRAADLLAIAAQRLDLAAGRLGAALRMNVATHRHDLAALAAPLRPGLLQRPIQVKAERLAALTGRLAPAARRRIERSAAALAAMESLRLSFDPNRPLSRGFARVHRRDGSLVRAAGALTAGDAVRLVFGDGDRDATIDRSTAPPARRTAVARRDQGQGSLF